MKIFLTHLQESITKGIKNINGKPVPSFKSASNKFYIYKNMICSIPLFGKCNLDHPYTTYEFVIMSKEWYKCRYYITINHGNNLIEYFRGKSFVDSILLYWKYYLKDYIIDILDTMYNELKYWVTTFINIFKIFK